MAASMQEIREGLAANLNAIEGLQVSAYALANPTPPTVEIVPAGIVYHQAMNRGLSVVTMTARAYVASSLDIGAQRRLDGYLELVGANSIQLALEADTTLGGVVDDIKVENVSGHQVFVREGQSPLLGSEWTVTVYASN